LEVTRSGPDNVALHAIEYSATGTRFGFNLS
jgi:hypothetical protein